MNSLLLESLFILLLSYQALCSSIWPNNKPKFTSSYLPPAVQILHAQTERLNDIRISTSTTTEAMTTTSAVTCRPQTEDSGDDCQTYSGPPEAAPVLGVDLIEELDGELNATTPISVLEVTETQSNVTVNSTLNLNQTVADQLTDDLTHDSDEETRITTSSNEKESNSTSNKEDEKNSDLLAPILTLERLRDILTADAKRQGLSKVQGYSEELLETLSISSTYSSRNQLRIVLIRMLKRGDAERRDSILMTKKIIEKLKDPESSLSSAFKLVPPLMFT